MYFGQDDIMEGESAVDMSWAYTLPVSEEVPPPQDAPIDYSTEREHAGYAAPDTVIAGGSGILDTIGKIFSLGAPVAIAALRANSPGVTGAYQPQQGIFTPRVSTVAQPSTIGASIGSIFTGNNILLFAGLGVAAFMLLKKRK